MASSRDLLTQWHRRFPGSVRWRCTPKGVEVEGGGHPRTRGQPATMTLFASKFEDALENVSERFGMPVELVLATLGAEGGPGLASVRHEPGYAAHLVKVNASFTILAEKDNDAAVRFLNLHWREIPVGAFQEADEATPHRVSIGPMHTLISTARSVMGDGRIDRAWLLQPANSILAGASYIAKQRKQTSWDPPVVAAAYNAGSVRENRSTSNPWRMVQYPIGTGRHVNRWVAFYNDAVAVVGGSTVFSVTHQSYWFGRGVA